MGLRFKPNMTIKHRRDLDGQSQAECEKRRTSLLVLLFPGPEGALVNWPRFDLVKG